MSLSSDFQACGPLPSATYAGWDAQTNQVPLWEVAGGGGGGGGSADGPAGAVQYSDGAGAFLGTANCVTDSAGNLYAENIEAGGTLQSDGGLTVAAGANITGEIIGGGNVTQSDTNATATLSIVKARSLSLLLPSSVPGSSMLNPVRLSLYALVPAGPGTPNIPLNSGTYTSAPTLVPAQGGWIVPAARVGIIGTVTNPAVYSGQFVLYNSDWNTDRDMLVMGSCSATVGNGDGGGLNFVRGGYSFNVIKDPNGTANGFLVNYCGVNSQRADGSFNGYTGAAWTSVNGTVPPASIGAGAALAWPWWAWDGPTPAGSGLAAGTCCPIFTYRVIKGHV